MSPLPALQDLSGWLFSSLNFRQACLLRHKWNTTTQCESLSAEICVKQYVVRVICSYNDLEESSLYWFSFYSFLKHVCLLRYINSTEIIFLIPVPPVDYTVLKYKVYVIFILSWSLLLVKWLLSKGIDVPCGKCHGQPIRNCWDQSF